MKLSFCISSTIISQMISLYMGSSIRLVGVLQCVIKKCALRAFICLFLKIWYNSSVRYCTYHWNIYIFSWDRYIITAIRIFCGSGVITMYEHCSLSSSKCWSGNISGPQLFDLCMNVWRTWFLIQIYCILQSSQHHHHHYDMVTDTSIYEKVLLLDTIQVKTLFI